MTESKIPLVTLKEILKATTTLNDMDLDTRYCQALSLLNNGDGICFLPIDCYRIILIEDIARNNYILTCVSFKDGQHILDFPSGNTKLFCYRFLEKGKIQIIPFPPEGWGFRISYISKDIDDKIFKKEIEE